MENPQLTPSRTWWTGLLIAGTALLLLHAWRYYPFLSDDAFISLRYADRLLSGKGLTWTDGERVEGYSNLLWVLSTASLGALKIDLTIAARITCAFGSIAALAALLCHCRVHYPQSRLAAVAAAAILTSCGSVAVWTLGGLEASLHAALICWAAVLMCQPDFFKNSKKQLLAAGALGLLALNRPDGILLTPVACMAAAFLAKCRKTARWKAPVAIMAAIPASTATAQTLGRLIYYGDIVPNTYHAKFALTSHRAQEALNYLGQGAWAHWATLLPLGMGLTTLAIRWALSKWGGTIKLLPNPPTSEILSQQETGAMERILVALSLSGAWLGLVFLGGGDIFPGWRHIVPAVPAIALVLTEILGAAEKNHRVGKTELWVALTAIVISNLATHGNNPENLRAKNELWSWLGKSTGEQLNRAWGHSPNPPLVAVSSAGALSFYSKLPTLDMFGLNDKNLTRMKPENFGQGRLAHELMNFEYVMGRKPDIIISHVGGAIPEFGMAEQPEFMENYQLVRFPHDPASNKFEPGFKSHAWIRKDRLADLIRQAPDVEIKRWRYWESDAR